MKQCVARSYAQGWTNTTNYLESKLEAGWIVKQSTPFIKNGTVEYIEYILEKDGEPHA